MKVITGLAGSARFPDGCVVAAGNFDGVHLGHQEVFTTAVTRARELDLPAVLLTFSSHPLTVVNPSAAPLPLMTVDDRLAIARRSGFEAAIVLDFDQELASMAPGEFAARILVERIGVRELVAGKGWRFGQGRSGDMRLLSELGADAVVWMRQSINLDAAGLQFFYMQVYGTAVRRRSVSAPNSG